MIERKSGGEFEVACRLCWRNDSCGIERKEILSFDSEQIVAYFPLKRHSQVEVTRFPCGPAFENS